MIGSAPCFEGLLLQISGFTSPDTCKQCKKEIKKRSLGDLTEKSTYQRMFDMQKLQKRRSEIKVLEKLITNLTK